MSTNKLLALVAAVSLSLTSVVVAIVGTKVQPNQYETMQKSVVLVRASDGQGSGVVIKRQNRKGQDRLFVWTANHVVENDSMLTIVKNIRHEGHRSGEATFKARVIGRDKNRDLALLWLDAPANYFRAAEFAEEKPIRVGTPLTHVGNVLGIAFEDSVSIGVMSQIGINPGGNWPWVLTDQYAGEAFFGSSGGPIFRTHDKAVVGLVVGGAVQSGFMQFVPVREIKAFADTNAVDWAVYGNWAPSDEFLYGLGKLHVLIQTFSVN